MKIRVAMSNVPTMTKLIALVTAGLFAAGTMFAGEHGNCTKQVEDGVYGFIGEPQPDT